MLINLGEQGDNKNCFCAEIFKTTFQIAENIKENYEVRNKNL